MSIYTLQAQGRRSIVALPEKIKEHRECRPGAKSKNIAPYTRGTKVIGKAERGARQHPGTSMFQKGDEAHKPPCFRRINSRTFGPQEDISVINGFREDTSNMTKWKDLRPAKSTRNCRTTRPTKVLLSRSCPIDLEGIPNGSTEAMGAISTTAHIQSTSRVVHLRRIECDVLLSPTGSEHEAFESLRFRRRIIRDYKFLHDVRRYLRVVRRRISLHASTKGLVPPDEGMRKIATFTRLLPSTELLHPRVREICSYVPPRSCARKTNLAYHCNANLRSRIPASEKGNRSPTADFNRYK
ncbi:hypothetical protein Bca52824_039722 [Brassica carinata]|uniref:Uncharacterized protein n=1 Tax=Brassica carinata TaxID=52824 RepID=A0A8X7RS60_BRACI|nr:hypothetical protein Bca52824_039722 [Brassica carinata]